MLSDLQCLSYHPAINQDPKALLELLPGHVRACAHFPEYRENLLCILQCSVQAESQQVDSQLIFIPLDYVLAGLFYERLRLSQVRRWV